MKRLLLAAVVLLVIVVAGMVYLNHRDEDRLDSATPPASPELVARGEYLARAGNCVSCHTTRGGAPYAGGRGIETPFGIVYASNITPDPNHGIGRWSAAEFWRALHNGRSRDGRFLIPAFPYPNYTHVSRADSDAIHAYLRTLAPVAQPNRAHGLRFPFDTQLALAAWRAMYFRPGVMKPDPARSPEWNRGAYLVQGLGHCNACHASRNLLGAASSLDLGGGLIPLQNWYAPGLNSPHEAGVADWKIEQIARLLKNGVDDKASSVLGPMAEVVRARTQYLSDSDLLAMATYLKALPQVVDPRDEAASRAARAASAVLHVPPASAAATAASQAAGERVLLGASLYKKHCAACHGDSGEGAPGAYPRLAGNRAVVMDPPANVVRVILAGGFAPATSGNPRPYGMPPFASLLNDDEVAAVASTIRGSWGNHADPVSTFDVQRYRVGLRE
jgi:mono/diheme cytochrome c family protein